MMTQQLLILTYASIGIALATIIVLVIRYFSIKSKNKKGKIIRYEEYLKWRKEFHDNFIQIEKEWNETFKSKKIRGI